MAVQLRLAMGGKQNFGPKDGDTPLPRYSSAKSGPGRAGYRAIPPLACRYCVIPPLLAEIARQASVRSRKHCPSGRRPCR
jgi:hypothetical protein